MEVEKIMLEQYIDACELVKETEERIARLKENRTILTDKVEGSIHEFPWVKTNFKIEGSPEDEIDLINREGKLLYLQKTDAYELKIKVEEWLSKVPIRIRRIVHFKYFDNLTWEEVADRLAGGIGGESVRKEFNRYLQNENRSD